MLIPGKHDAIVVKGASWAFRVRWLVGNNEDPVDLTGWSGQLLIKAKRQDAESRALAVCSTANGRLELDEDGNVTARLTKAQVESLPVGTMFYELELMSSTESVQLLAGRLKVDA